MKYTLILTFLSCMSLAGLACSHSAPPAPTLPARQVPVQQAQPTPQPQPVEAKDLHGLQLVQTWTVETRAAQIQFAYVYLVEGPERLGSEVDAATGRVDFLTYKLCLLSPPAQPANQGKCDKLIDRVEAEGNRLPKW
jgi:hypothetical protein